MDESVPWVPRVSRLDGVSDVTLERRGEEEQA